MFLQLWRLEVQGLGTERVGVWGELSPRFADGRLPLCLDMTFLPRMYTTGISSTSSKDMGPIGLGPHPCDLINPDNLLKGLIFKYNHIGG